MLARLGLFKSAFGLGVPNGILLGLGGITSSHRNVGWDPSFR